MSDVNLSLVHSVIRKFLHMIFLTNFHAFALSIHHAEHKNNYSSTKSPCNHEAIVRAPPLHRNKLPSPRRSTTSHNEYLLKSINFLQHPILPEMKIQITQSLKKDIRGTAPGASTLYDVANHSPPPLHFHQTAIVASVKNWGFQRNGGTPKRNQERNKLFNNQSCNEILCSRDTTNSLSRTVVALWGGILRIYVLTFTSDAL